jgi:hypothetical protein
MHRAARTVVLSGCLSHYADCEINPHLQARCKLAGLKDSGSGWRVRVNFCVNFLRELVA